jgi:hypothetical protein
VKLTSHFHIVAVEPYPYSLYDFTANTGTISLTFISKIDHIVNECLLNYLIRLAPKNRILQNLTVS